MIIAGLLKLRSRMQQTFEHI